MTTFPTWALDPAVSHLNHGSFGAATLQVLAAQERYRARMEQDPYRFMMRELEGLLDQARHRLAAFLGADPEGLAFVPNTTTAVSTVLACLPLQPGDEVVGTSHMYPAVRNALKRYLEPRGARLVEAPVPFPIEGPEQVVTAVLEAVTPRTRLAVLDHITSPTGLVFPIEALVGALAERGIDTFVDGAHAPGQVPLDLTRLGAAYYAGNGHKWLCGPKGSAFLVVREDRRTELHPLATSNGASSTRQDRNRFRLEFDWTGTADPSPYLALADALSLPPAGWEPWMAANHALVLAGRDVVNRALGLAPAAPDAMVGAMAAICLPDAGPERPQPPYHLDPLQERLYVQHGIHAMIFGWPAYPHRVLRLSAQRYNTLAEYERLAEVLSG